MSSKARANIELGLNIVIAIAVVAVAGVVVKRYLSTPQANHQSVLQQSQALVGTRLNVPDVNWAQNEKSLVFFLMKNCVYCKASAPFYRQLIEDAAKRNVKLLAILPNPVEEGKEYVKSLDLPIENVQTAQLSAYKIPATPTVLFVDGQGVVKGVWVGADPSLEHEIRDKLIALYEAKGSQEPSAK